MSRIAEVARLKELVGRRNAIIEREGDPRTPNYAILERMEIERDMMGAAPWLLAVAGQFQAGHAAALIEIADILEQAGFVAKAAYIRPLIEAAKVMEAAPCQ